MVHVLCAGDRFITAESFAAAVREVLGDGTPVVEHRSAWPDEPFGEVEGVKEAAGPVAELARLAHDAEVILTHLAPVTASVIEAAPRLKVIGITRGGPVNVDLAAATAAGVPVVYLPGRNLGAVAEFVVGVTISLMRGVVRSAAELSDGRWDPFAFHGDTAGPELRASTVGLVGLGAVGRRVAQLLGAFGARLVVFDPYADEAAAREVGATLVDSLRELLVAADVVSVHARLTDDTRGMFGAETFASMKPGSFFVNTARGELVDQAALLSALESGRLAGAALDVFAPEPPAVGDALLARPDVVATPHIAGASREVALESVQKVVAEVASFLADGLLVHCANPDWAAAASGRG